MGSEEIHSGWWNVNKVCSRVHTPKYDARNEAGVTYLGVEIGLACMTAMVHGQCRGRGGNIAAAAMENRLRKNGQLRAPERSKDR